MTHSSSNKIDMALIRETLFWPIHEKSALLKMLKNPEDYEGLSEQELKKAFLEIVSSSCTES